MIAVGDHVGIVFSSSIGDGEGAVVSSLISSIVVLPILGAAELSCDSTVICPAGLGAAVALNMVICSEVSAVGLGDETISPVNVTGDLVNTLEPAGNLTGDLVNTEEPEVGLISVADNDGVFEST